MTEIIGTLENREALKTAAVLLGDGGVDQTAMHKFPLRMQIPAGAGSRGDLFVPPAVVRYFTTISVNG
jgi:hypothetical protein